MTVERPAFCTDEHLDYLDKLRESGATSLFYVRLVRAFTLSPDEASKVRSYWIATHPRKESA